MEPKKKNLIVDHSTTRCLIHESLQETFAFLYSARTPEEHKKIEMFTTAICDIHNDLHDDGERFRRYIDWLRRQGHPIPPRNIEELGALAERIEEHLTAAEVLGWNKC